MERNQSITTAASGRKSTAKAPSTALKDAGICTMRDRVVEKKMKKPTEANTQLSMKKKVSKVMKKAEAVTDGRQLTRLLN